MIGKARGKMMTQSEGTVIGKIDGTIFVNNPLLKFFSEMVCDPQAKVCKVIWTSTYPQIFAGSSINT